MVIIHILLLLLTLLMVVVVSLHNKLLLLLLLLVCSSGGAVRRKRFRILRSFRKLRSWYYDLTIVVIICKAHISLMELLFNGHIVTVNRRYVWWFNAHWVDGGHLLWLIIIDRAAKHHLRLQLFEQVITWGSKLIFCCLLKGQRTLFVQLLLGVTIFVVGRLH